MTWNVSLHAEWFDLVAAGKKLYEGRRMAYDVPSYKVGDLIRIRSIPDRRALIVEIVRLDYFSTFEEALTALPIDEVLPGSTIEEGVVIYQRYVSLPTQLRDGVCMIKLSLRTANPTPARIELGRPLELARQSDAPMLAKNGFSRSDATKKVG